MNTLILVALAGLSVLLCYAAYWSGRNTGERSAYWSQREKMDDLREANLELRLQVERMRPYSGSDSLAKFGDAVGEVGRTLRQPYSDE